MNQDKQKEKIVRSFIEDSNIFELSKDVADITIKIRRSRKIRTPDAIIAATAIVNNFTLVSGDNDFVGIQGLNLLNPRELK